MKTTLSVTFVVGAVVLGFAVGAAAQDQNGLLAHIMPGAGIVTWVPVDASTGLSLTVIQPDGGVFEKTFPAGRTPRYRLTNAQDGQYSWELRPVLAAQSLTREPGGNDGIDGAGGGSGEVQGGSFRVSAGNMLDPYATEDGTSALDNLVDTIAAKDSVVGAKDICYVDDLIVDGSICVGFDCTCNYSFGFDTLVLKENNLRIFFDDTSTSASFPRNDWRIVANDSANGGASYLGIEDSTAGRRVFTVEAGAPSHSLFVDDGGRVGFGTSTPSVDLHVVSGNTPTLRLQQDGSSGFAPQTWDVAGNETNFFVRDVTNGSTLPFRIQPDAPNNVVTIRADGKVGFGTWGPSYPMHLLTNSSTDAKLYLERTSGASAFMLGGSTAAQLGSSTNHQVEMFVNNSLHTTFKTDGSLRMATGARCNTSGQWKDASSRALKENIEELTTDDAMKTLAGLKPVTFNYKANPDEGSVGFIAEDVPDLVASEDRETMGAMDVTAVLTKVAQQQQDVIARQQAVIAQLLTRVEALENTATAGDTP